LSGHKTKTEPKIMTLLICL